MILNFFSSNLPNFQKPIFPDLTFFPTFPTTYTRKYSLFMTRKKVNAGFFFHLWFLQKLLDQKNWSKKVPSSNFRPQTKKKFFACFNFPLLHNSFERVSPPKITKSLLFCVAQFFWPKKTWWFFYTLKTSCIARYFDFVKGSFIGLKR